MQTYTCIVIIKQEADTAEDAARQIQSCIPSVTEVKVHSFGPDQVVMLEEKKR